MTHQKDYVASPGQYVLPRKIVAGAGLRAAIIAATTSLYIVRTCLCFVYDAIQAQGDRVRTGASSSDAATLWVVVPLSFVIPFAAWYVARITRSGVQIARCAVLIAVAIWLLSVSFLKFWSH